MTKAESALSRAASAQEIFGQWQRDQIVKLLKAIADQLDASSSELIALAGGETNLPEARLTGEVVRMTGQWRHMAAGLEKGDYLSIVRDAADSSIQPPRPDLRKTTVPIGVVAVFGASNFPFAFGVGGCDTASAIAAGCAVVIKSHPGHPKTSRRVFELMCDAAKSLGAPDGLINLVEDFDDGIKIVTDQRVSAVAFTGSTSGGRALFDLAQSREIPIPFYGELGGLNPVFVSFEAQRENSKTIAKGFLDSVTLGAGQFCTKPGYLIVIDGSEILNEIRDQIPSVKVHPMLNKQIQSAYTSNRDALASYPFVNLVAQGDRENDGSEPVSIYQVRGADFLKNRDLALKEVFGPTAVVVTCESGDELLEVAESFHGTLASGVHGDPGDEVVKSGLVDILVRLSGRVIWNSWPTGVAVTWAMHHGGPYPASTNSLFTSIGADSIKRFRRPVTFQNFPETLLPQHLRDL